MTSLKNGGGGLKVTWSNGISGGSFTTNRNGSRDPRNQWRTSHSKLFLRHYLFSNFLKNTCFIVSWTDLLKQKNCECDEFEDKSIILLIPIYCFKFKKKWKHTWMQLIQTCGDRLLIEIDLIVWSLFADRERAIDPRPRSRSRSRSKGCDQFWSLIAAPSVNEKYNFFKFALV